MRAELRSLMSLDVDDLPSFKPQPAEWAIRVRALVGPAGAPGEESFDFTACSVGWVAAQVLRDGIFDGRHCLVVDDFDWAALSSYVERRVQACEGATWGDVASLLSQLGYWEFEDYRQ
jgi:hypothetical protein